MGSGGALAAVPSRAERREGLDAPALLVLATDEQRKPRCESNRRLLLTATVGGSAAISGR